jgi:hypothetical protein
MGAVAATCAEARNRRLANQVFLASRDRCARRLQTTGGRIT